MELEKEIEKRNAAIANLVLEVAAEKQRADQLQDEARKAAAFVRAEQKRYEALAQELAAAKSAIPAQTGIPFMYGIMSADGHAHIDECCVAGNPQGLYAELNALNDSPDAGYTIVPLYAAQPVQEPEPVVKNKDRDLCQKCLGFGERYGETCDCGDGLEPVAPVAAPVVGQDRAGFEAWCDVHGFDTQKFTDSNGVHYEMVGTRAYWIGWDARSHAAPAPAASVQPELTDAYRALQNTLLVVPDGDFKRQMDDWLSQRLGVIGADVLPVPAIPQPNSGRDAALVSELNAAHRYYGDPGAEWLDLARRAAERLAAHPANVAQVGELSHDHIRQIFLASGFTIKEGQTDLKDYVYKAAYALIAAMSAPAKTDKG